MLDRFDFLTGAFGPPKEMPRGAALQRIDEDGLYHSPNVCFATDTPFMQDGAQTTAATDLSGATVTLNGWQSSGQFLAVQLVAARSIDKMTAATQVPYGILQNKPKTGQAAEVAIAGICKAMSSDTIVAGAAVMATTDGTLINRTTGSANALIGYAIEAAVSGQIFTIRLQITPVLT